MCCILHGKNKKNFVSLQTNPAPLLFPRERESGGLKDEQDERTRWKLFLTWRREGTPGQPAVGTMAIVSQATNIYPTAVNITAANASDEAQKITVRCNNFTTRVQHIGIYDTSKYILWM